MAKRKAGRSAKVWIKSFRITNYKSFEDSGEHTLGRHMNVIVGQNNAGKTAMLQAISQRIQYRPHRNSRQRLGKPLNTASAIHVEFCASQHEVRNGMMHAANVRVPLPASWQGAPNKFLELPEVQFSTTYRRRVSGGEDGWAPSKFPSNNLELDGQGISVRFSANDARTEFALSDIQQGRPDLDEIGIRMAGRLMERTYVFDALRAPAHQSPAGSNQELRADAQNLPEVLSTFQPNRTLYQRYLDQVRGVLPLVKWVDVVPVGSASQIRVWDVG